MDFEIIEQEEEDSVFDLSGETKGLEAPIHMQDADDAWIDISISAVPAPVPSGGALAELMKDAPAHVLQDYQKYRAEIEAEQSSQDPSQRVPFVPVTLIRSEETVIDGMDDVVIPAQEAKIAFDYPLSVTAISTVKASTPLGITRGDILLAIHDGYAQIYEEEDTASPPSKVEDRGFLENREETQGRFGIFGHDIDDLVVEGISFREHDGSYFIAMDIGS